VDREVDMLSFPEKAGRREPRFFLLSNYYHFAIKFHRGGPLRANIG